MNLYRSVLAIIAVTALSGCASFNMIKAPPLQQQPVQLSFSNEGPSGWSDLPIGAYRVPNSNVIISGHQGNGAGLAGLFGIVGVLAADATERSAGAKKVRNVENSLHIDLTTEAREDAQAILATKHFEQNFSLTPTQGGGGLTISPFVVLTFVDENDVQPFVILKATLSGDKSEKRSWSTHYVATVGKPLPLIGDSSLTSNGAERLTATLGTELKLGTQAMLTDIANSSVRNDKDIVYLETGVPFNPRRMALLGPRIEEDENFFAVAPKIADANVTAGIYVFDKSTTTYRAATAGDKLRYLDDEKQVAALSRSRLAKWDDNYPNLLNVSIGFDGQRGIALFKGYQSVSLANLEKPSQQLSIAYIELGYPTLFKHVAASGAKRTMPLRLLGIVKALMRDPNTLSAYIHDVEEYPTFDVRLKLAKILPSIEYLAVQQSKDLIAAFNENSQARDC